jgi:hypothetical protein
MSLRTVSAAMVALVAIGSAAPAYANPGHRDGPRHFYRHADRGHHRHHRGYKHRRSGNWIIRGILSPGTR